ncbi:DUF3035 domain-containing protein [Pseudodonghicola flavimaris]|uniref:DUF3035 domain-containing protein n=1 Tax=Pseudodonghicola flavimaris TaxID=3050036 RepID=A0ABT7EWR1_9RHOB|nr:DUF3035 domain-containing protein [Pseudodonghicola flavimaris]MDK3016772.1 DUF3035 domain-containing protein [Pseudodonghicola flavimaris]
MRRPLGMIILMLATVAVAGCSNKGLRQLRSAGPGPDEFMILPVKPLTAPQNYSELPAPTPGGKNLVDPTPTGDAMAALGGRSIDGIPASDATLITAASRNGVDPNVRQELAEVDAKFRKRQSRMTRLRLFRVDRYEQAYRRQALDPFPTTATYRASGADTPSSPPEKP